MRVPVILGAATVVQHTSAERPGLEAVALMAEACRRAAGATGLAARADLVAVPRGAWRYPDAGRLVAAAIGAPKARTLCAEIGVLQTTVLSAAFEAVAEGRADIAVVVGGEALDRRRVARRAGRRAQETVPSATLEADEILRPAGDFRGVDESSWGLDDAFVQYALIDSARRHAAGIGIEANRREIARLWSGFSAVAEANPTAWEPTAWSPADLLDDSRPGNRLLAYPYTAKLVTQMYVDQAVAILIGTTEAAEQAGIEGSPWCYPALTVDCEVAVPLVERVRPECCEQWGVVGDTIQAELGSSAAEFDLVDLYSCFPVAVAQQRDALALSDREDLTVTGGMTFGGGPLNSSALQAVARSCELLRGRAGATAMVTAISGFQTKQGAVVLMSERPPTPYRRVDVTGRARPLVGRRDVVAVYSGPADVQATTVVVPRAPDEPAQAVAVLAAPDGRGTVGRSSDPAVVAAFVTEDWVGRTISVIGGHIAPTLTGRQQRND